MGCACFCVCPGGRAVLFVFASVAPSWAEEKQPHRGGWVGVSQKSSGADASSLIKTREP